MALCSLISSKEDARHFAGQRRACLSRITFPYNVYGTIAIRVAPLFSVCPAAGASAYLRGVAPCIALLEGKYLSMEDDGKNKTAKKANMASRVALQRAGDARAW